jgi:hypothetical protein
MRRKAALALLSKNQPPENLRPPNQKGHNFITYINTAFPTCKLAGLIEAIAKIFG